MHIALTPGRFAAGRVRIGYVGCTTEFIMKRHRTRASLAARLEDRSRPRSLVADTVIRVGRGASALAALLTLTVGCWTLKPASDLPDSGTRDVATVDAGRVDVPAMDAMPPTDVVAADASMDVFVAPDTTVPDVPSVDASVPVDVPADLPSMDAGACMPCVFGTSLIGHCCLM